MQPRRAKARSTVALAAAAAFTFAATAWAGEADVVSVNVTAEKDGTFSFVVGVRHDDEGWNHYADRWEILAPNGAVLETRILHHPNVDEQPSVRSITRVYIPEKWTKVTIRARDNVHGYGGKTQEVALPGR